MWNVFSCVAFSICLWFFFLLLSFYLFFFCFLIECRANRINPSGELINIIGWKTNEETRKKNDKLINIFFEHELNNSSQITFSFEWIFLLVSPWTTNLYIDTVFILETLCSNKADKMKMRNKMEKKRWCDNYYVNQSNIQKVSMIFIILIKNAMNDSI